MFVSHIRSAQFDYSNPCSLVCLGGFFVHGLFNDNLLVAVDGNLDLVLNLPDGFLDVPDGLLGVGLDQDFLENSDGLLVSQSLNHAVNSPLGGGSRLEGRSVHSSGVDFGDNSVFEDVSDPVEDVPLSSENVVSSPEDDTVLRRGESVLSHDGVHPVDSTGVMSGSMMDEGVEVMNKSLVDDQLVHVTGVHNHMTF
jgi:hypothetical protein